MNTLKRKVRKSSNRKGFTLIELIVVIVIIGILAAIAIPSLGGFQATARFKADIATGKTIATAAQTYITNEGTAPALADLEDFITGGIPDPQYNESDDAAFDITVESGEVTMVFVDVDGDKAYASETDIALWPTPMTDGQDRY